MRSIVGKKLIFAYPERDVASSPEVIKNFRHLTKGKPYRIEGTTDCGSMGIRYTVINDMGHIWHANMEAFVESKHKRNLPDWW